MKISSLSKGLVAHYPLDVASLRGALGLADKTPNSNHGVSANTPVFTTDRKGQANRAMSFNGGTDKISANSVVSDVDLTTTGNSSMCGWFKRTAGSGVSFQGFGVDGFWDNYSFFYFSDSFVRYSMKGGDGAIVEATDNTDYSGEWVHVCAVKTGVSGELFVNGEIKDTGTGLSANITADSFDVGWAYSDLYGFDGDIEDLRIYNRVLSPQEITTLYESYRPKISAGSLQKGLVLDMPLTSKRYDAGNTLFKDLTPYENTGANTGGDVDTDHTTFVAANSDTVRIADSAILDITPATSAFIWVKGAPQNNLVLFSKYDYGTNQRSWDFISDNISPYHKFRVAISDDGTLNSGHGQIYTSSIVAFDNTWHLVGFTFNAGTLKLFVDGVEDTNPTKIQDDAITTIHNSTADGMVGSYLNNNTPTSFFDGDLSGAKIWNRALSDQEILLLYEKGRN